MLGFDLVVTDFPLHLPAQISSVYKRGASSVQTDPTHTFNKSTFLLNSHCVQGTLLGNTGLKAEKKGYSFFFKLCC